MTNINERLEFLRCELRAERISYGELAELQSLATYIDPGDVELLEAASVPEHAEDATRSERVGPSRRSSQEIGGITMADKLTQVVRCALADMISLYYEGGLTNDAKRTITELYEALKENGEDVSEYEGDYGNVVEDIDEE